MQNYDQRGFNPPAPVASVSLRNPQSAPTAPNVLLLLDTGADLPRPAVERLAIDPLAGERYELLSFDGSHSFAPVVSLDMLFMGRAFRGRYLLIEGEVGVLGRTFSTTWYCC